MPIEETVQIVLFISALAALPVIAISFVLNFFVALSSPPTERAAWVVGLAYLATAILWVIWGPEEYQLYAPVVPLPGALIVFLFRRNEYRKAWIENPEQLPEGTSLADDNWKSGLIKLAALFAFALAVTLGRQFLRSGF